MEGLPPSIKLHDYTVSQWEVRWPIKEAVEQLENEKTNLLPTSVYGQNIVMYPDISDLLTSADAHKCENTVQAVNLID